MWVGGGRELGAFQAAPAVTEPPRPDAAPPRAAPPVDLIDFDAFFGAGATPSAPRAAPPSDLLDLWAEPAREAAAPWPTTSSSADGFALSPWAWGTAPGEMEPFACHDLGWLEAPAAHRPGASNPFAAAAPRAVAPGC